MKNWPHKYRARPKDERDELDSNIEFENISEIILDDIVKGACKSANMADRAWPCYGPKKSGRTFWINGDEHLVVFSSETVLAHYIKVEQLDDYSNLIFWNWILKFKVSLYDPNSIDDFKSYIWNLHDRNTNE